MTERDQSESLELIRCLELSNQGGVPRLVIENVDVCNDQ